MFLCDLPYGQTQNEWDTPLPLEEMWTQIWRVAKNSAAVVLFANGLFTARLALSTPYFRYSLIWKKGNRTTGFLNAKRMPLRNHEDILVFYRKLPSYNPQMRKGAPLHGSGSLLNARKSTNYGSYACLPQGGGSTDKYPTSILDFDKPHPAIHPTQKPVDLCRYLIRTYTNPGDVVCDFTMGSGTAGVASVQEGRAFIGCEMDKGIFVLAQKRIEEARLVLQ
jgi:DNA modification methylase